MDVLRFERKETGWFSSEPDEQSPVRLSPSPAAQGDHSWLRARCLKVIRCAFTASEWTVLLPNPCFQSAMDRAVRLDQAEGIIHLGITLIDAKRRSEENGSESADLLKLQASLSAVSRDALTLSPAVQPPAETPLGAEGRDIMSAVPATADAERRLAAAL